MENQAFYYFNNLNENKNSNANNNQTQSVQTIHDDRGFAFSQYSKESKYVENTENTTNNDVDSTQLHDHDGRGFAPHKPSNWSMQTNENKDMKANEKKAKQRKPWLMILKEYTSISTIHGLYHIAAAQPFLLRRILWLLLFLGCAGILVVQVSTNVMYYLSWPMSVDVRINYNDSILFPAVTICNQNAIRSTVAYNESMYEIVSSLFTEVGHSGPDHNVTEHITWFEGHPATSMRLDELYHMAGHSAQDLIVSCEFHGAECTHADFVPALTDFGLCYTFNSPGGNVSVRRALATGAEGGLRLHLNIEQYEYMKGPNTGAGLKLQVHNQDEPPLVRDQGIAIPPGSQAFVAVKTIEINNLGAPHGKCNNTLDLDFYSHYTMTTCKINCKQTYVLDRCRCRDIYMSSKSDYKLPGSTVCTLDEYADCLQPTLDEFGTLSGSECDCPVPCYRLAYEPSVSYATASNYDIDSLLHSMDTVESIREKYVHARNIQQRVTDATVIADTEMITELNQTVATIGVMLRDLKTQLSGDYKDHEEMYGHFQNRLDFHEEEGLGNVEYIIKHDFLRGWDVYKERAFNYVTQDFYDIPLQFKRALQNYSTLLPNSTETTRRLVTFPLLNLAHGRLECIERAFGYLNETQNAYYTGDPLLTYKATLDRHYDMSFITMGIIQTGIEWEPDQYENLLLSFTWLTDGLNALMDICEEFAQTGNFSEELYSAAEADIIRGGRRYNYRLFMYESRLVVPPYEKIQEIIENFELLNRTLANTHEEYLRKSSELQDFVAHFTDTHFHLLSEFSSWTADYLSNLSFSKTTLGEFASSEDMSDLPGLMTLFFSDLRDLLYGLQQQLIQLSIAYQDMWRSVVEEETTSKFYEHVYNDSTAFLSANASDPSDNEAYLWTLFSKMLGKDEDELRNLTKEEVVERMNGDFHIMDIEHKLMSIDQMFVVMSNNLEASHIIGHDDNHLRIAFDNLTTALKTFSETNKVDSSFYRENFMRLDVYMQELSYEVVSQQASYDSAQLLSDIGGSVGLFVGGSVLSLFELIDVFVHNGFRRLMNR